MRETLPVKAPEYRLQDDESARGARRKKQRGRWCRGRVGVEHCWAWVAAETLPQKRGWYCDRWWRSEIAVCESCDRQSRQLSRRVCRLCREVQPRDRRRPWRGAPERCVSCGHDGKEGA